VDDAVHGRGVQHDVGVIVHEEHMTKAERRRTHKLVDVVARLVEQPTDVARLNDNEVDGKVGGERCKRLALVERALHALLRL
jgi:hypothetical protein